MIMGGGVVEGMLMMHRRWGGGTALSDLDLKATPKPGVTAGGKGLVSQGESKGVR